MSKSDQQYGTDELKELLRKLPEEKEPPYLTHRIMKQIGAQPPSLAKRIIRFFMNPVTFTFHPVRLAGGLAALGLAFWMGLSLNPQDIALQPNSKSTQNLSAQTGLDTEKIFLQGRHLLVSGEREQALIHLQEAGKLVPENPEYAYYEGLAYQATNNLKLERASYQRGLEHATDSLPLLLNLGHNLLESRELDAALAQYEAVLALNPQEPAALYNKGLIYREKGQHNEELEAWRQYLVHHRSGKWAWRAVSHLNDLGDFRFRSYQLGNRKIVLSHQALLGEDTPLLNREREIRILALLLLENPGLDLHIVTFEEKNRPGAKSQARELRNLLLAIMGKQEESRIRLSWFGEAETFTAKTNTYKLPKGILIFGSKKTEKKEEKRI